MNHRMTRRNRNESVVRKRPIHTTIDIETDKTMARIIKEGKADNYSDCFNFLATQHRQRENYTITDDAHDIIRSMIESGACKDISDAIIYLHKVYETAKHGISKDIYAMAISRAAENVFTELFMTTEP